MPGCVFHSAAGRHICSLVCSHKLIENSPRKFHPNERRRFRTVSALTRICRVILICHGTNGGGRACSTQASSGFELGNTRTVPTTQVGTGSSRNTAFMRPRPCSKTQLIL